MSKPGIILCMRVGDIESPVVGSIIRPCDDCGTDVYVAPQSVSIMTEAADLSLHVVAICFPCALVRTQESDDEDSDIGVTGRDEFLNRLLDAQMRKPDS